MANVMALCVEQVADVIAIGGRWNSHLRVDFILIFLRPEEAML